MPPRSSPLSPVRRTAAALALIGGLVPGAAPQAAEPAHVHGLVRLELVIEPRQLSLRLEAPQDSLLGHERVPRSAAERQAAAAALQRLAAPAALVGLPAGAGCRPGPAQVDAPKLQPGAAAATAGDGHAEVVADWRFDCADTAALRQLDLGGLLDAFPRIQRVQAEVAAPAGQHQARLQRPQRQLRWGR